MVFKVGDRVRFADNLTNRSSVPDLIGKVARVERVDRGLYLEDFPRPHTVWWSECRFEKVDPVKHYIVLRETGDGSIGLVKAPCQFVDLDEAKALMTTIARDAGKAFVVKVVAEAVMPHVDPVITDY